MTLASLMLVTLSLIRIVQPMILKVDWTIGMWEQQPSLVFRQYIWPGIKAVWAYTVQFHIVNAKRLTDIYILINCRWLATKISKWEFNHFFFVIFHVVWTGKIIHSFRNVRRLVVAAWIDIFLVVSLKTKFEIREMY